MSVAGVVLAAGGSARLGEPKQLVELEGERLLERAVRLAREAGLSPVIVVLGARAAEIATQCDLRGAQIERCERWTEGMSQAIAVGIRAAQEQGVKAAVVMTSDMPFVTPEHLRALCKRRDAVRASSYDGRNGVPAHFPASTFFQLQALQGDAGARALLKTANAVALGEAALDVDTPQDVITARERLGAMRRLRKGAR